MKRDGQSLNLWEAACWRYHWWARWEIPNHDRGDVYSWRNGGAEEFELWHAWAEWRWAAGEWAFVHFSAWAGWDGCWYEVGDEWDCVDKPVFEVFPFESEWGEEDLRRYLGSWVEAFKRGVWLSFVCRWRGKWKCVFEFVKDKFYWVFFRWTYNEAIITIPPKIQREIPCFHYSLLPSHWLCKPRIKSS